MRSRSHPPAVGREHPGLVRFDPTAHHPAAGVVPRGEVSVLYHDFSTITKPDVNGVPRFRPRDRFRARTWLDR